jgi:hypothetical protein
MSDLTLVTQAAVADLEDTLAVLSQSLQNSVDVEIPSLRSAMTASIANGASVFEALLVAHETVLDHSGIPVTTQTYRDVTYDTVGNYVFQFDIPDTVNPAIIVTLYTPAALYATGAI